MHPPTTNAQIETERVSEPNGDILEKIAVVVPVKKVAKPGPTDKKGTVRGNNSKSISPRANMSEKRRSVSG